MTSKPKNPKALPGMSQHGDDTGSAGAPSPQQHHLQSQIPLPPRLEMKGNLAQNWKRWKQIWDSFEIASRLTEQPDKYRVATFIMCIGPDALEVYNALPFAAGDAERIERVMEMMANYCTGQTNVIYERYRFNNRDQEEGESIDAYTTALRSLAQTCNFATFNDELIRDRIVCGIRDNGLRKRLLQEPKLTLTRCLDMCRATESAVAHLKAMRADKEDKEEAVHALQAKRNPKRDTRQRPNIPECNYCGKEHERSKEKCPAYGQRCKRCGKENHFASKCRQRQERKVHHVHDWEDTDDEYCFTLSVHNEVKATTTNPLKSRIWATMMLGDKPIRFQLDTGASCNIIPRQHLPQESQLQRIGNTLTMYNGTEMKAIGKSSAHLVNPKNGRTYQAEFIVVEEDAAPLLGSQTTQEMELIKVKYENIATVQRKVANTPETNVAKPAEDLGAEPPNLSECTKENFLKEFEDVFTGNGKFNKKLHLEVDTSVTPVKQPLRRVPVAMKSKLKEELARLEKEGVIQQVDTPTDWVSSLVVVKKPNGKLRICIDPKPLNQALKRSHYPMPVVDDILPELANAKVFSVCDVKNGFWHVELDEASSMLTTFGTPFGRYRWLRMPFGISPAPEIFQRFLEQALENLPGVKTVADDILIYGEGQTLEDAVHDHDQKIRKLFERCREKGITLNKEKLKLRATEVSYMGHVLTKEGLRPDPAKVEAIRDMSTPTDVTAVQRLVGMVNYLTQFLKHLADLCEPLRQLTRQDVEWQWTDSHDEAFRKIKQAVSNTPVLRYFNPREETVLQCDASSTGLGATLMQQGQPVAYASRSLTDTERNYAQIEKELLAIVFATEKFNQYTYGRRVVVESDHKPLETIYKKPLVAAPKRLQRMLLRLQKYELDIHFKPGRQMHLADTLSRAHPTNASHASEAAPEVLTIEAELSQINMIEFLPISQPRIDEIKQETENDTTMQTLKATILKGWPRTKSEVPPEIAPYFQIRDELTVQHGIIFRGERCIVPRALRHDIMGRIHRSHIGMEGCLRRARESIYWPGMTSAVRDYISQCEICRSYETAQSKETLCPHEVPERPWSKVAVDLFEHDDHHYLVTVDYFSNFWEVDRLDRDTRSRAVIHKLKQHFARHGIPDTVMSDNGPQFAGHEFKQFAEEWEFEHITSSPGHAQSNGMAESAVKTAKSLLKKAQKAKTDPWLAVLDHRNTPSVGMTSSPAQRLMSRRTKTLLPTSGQLLKPMVVEGAKEEKERRTARQARYYDQAAKDLPPLNKGAAVRIQPLKDRKGPWMKATVGRRVDSRSYRVRTDEGAVLRRNRRHLRATKEMPRQPNPQELEVEIPDPQELEVEMEMQQPVPGNQVPEAPEQPGPPRPTETRQQAAEGHTDRARPHREVKLPERFRDYLMS